MASDVVELIDLAMVLLKSKGRLINETRWWEGNGLIVRHRYQDDWLSIYSPHAITFCGIANHEARETDSEGLILTPELVGESLEIIRRETLLDKLALL